MDTKNRYLVFAGDNYYPRPAWRDFKGAFATKDEALEYLATRSDDWHQIVDLDTLQETAT